MRKESGNKKQSIGISREPGGIVGSFVIYLAQDAELMCILVFIMNPLSKHEMRETVGSGASPEPGRPSICIRTKSVLHKV